MNMDQITSIEGSRGLDMAEGYLDDGVQVQVG